MKTRSLLSDADELRLLVKATERELRLQTERAWAAHIARFAASLEEPDYLLAKLATKTDPVVALQDSDEP